MHLRSSAMASLLVLLLPLPALATGPSDAQCDKALTHVIGLMAKTLPPEARAKLDEAEVRKDMKASCLHEPAYAVECLLQATTMEEVSDCDDHPSKAQCARVVDHMLGLARQEKDLPPAARAKLDDPKIREQAIVDCRKETPDKIACLVDSPTLVATHSCDRKAHPELCHKAYFHMIQLVENDPEADQKMLAEMRGDAMQKRAATECAEQSPDTVRCVVAARSFKDAMMCGQQASLELCEKAYDRLILLFEREGEMPADTLEKMKTPEVRKKALSDCQKEKPEEIRCMLHATSVRAVMACSKSRPTPRNGTSDGTTPPGKPGDPK